MAIPTFVAAGTAGAGTGAVTPGMPAGATTGDLLILIIEGAGEDANADAPPTGGAWAGVGVTSRVSSTSGAVDNTRCSVYWAVYDAGINLTVPDAGNHTLARVYAFRGVDLDDPFNDTATGSTTGNASDHSVATGIDTTVDECLVCLAVTLGDDNVATESLANTSLTDVASRGDAETSSGGDGGLALFSGILATAGSGGTFTWTTDASEDKAWIAFALQPEAATPATVTPGAIGLSAVIPAASAHGAAVSEPAQIATAATLGAVTVAGPAVVSPNTVTLSVALPQLSVVGGAVTGPGVLELAVTIPQASAAEGAASAAVTPATITTAATLPAPSVSAGGVVTPAVIARAVSVLQATASGAAAVAPSVVARVVAMPAASPDGGAVAAPAATATSVTLPGVTLVGAAVVEPGVVVLVVDIPQAAALQTAGSGTYQEGGLFLVIQSGGASSSGSDGMVAATHVSGGLTVGSQG